MLLALRVAEFPALMVRLRLELLVAEAPIEGMGARIFDRFDRKMKLSKACPFRFLLHGLQESRAKAPAPMCSRNCQVHYLGQMLAVIGV